MKYLLFQKLPIGQDHSNCTTSQFYEFYCFRSETQVDSVFFLIFILTAMFSEQFSGFSNKYMFFHCMLIYIILKINFSIHMRKS